MAYLSPSTEPTERACIKCEHFGGWPGSVNGAAWCLHTRHMHSLSYSGCSSWTQQPEGWVPPPDCGPTPGAVVNASQRHNLARMR